MDMRNIAKMNTKCNMNDAVTFDRLAARGWSARKAALHVGVTPAHLCRVCRGERVASRALLRALKRLPQLPPVKVHKKASV